MRKLVEYLFLGLLILKLMACTPGKPYEIRSPCVAIESENSGITPCVRRPVNLNRSLV